MSTVMDDASFQDASLRLLSGGETEFGVHIAYEDLYKSIVFLAAIFVGGKVASNYLLMPSLVGEILVGVALGPMALDYVHNAEAFVMLGEIGLILLVIEAGIDIDLSTLKLIGARGVTIAIIGSILPIALGIGIAFALGNDVVASIAAGSAFGPTSLGIAMNILRTAKIINTPVGQMIVAAAVIDDMIALVVLSQLRSLTGEVTVKGILIPIISALLFLVVGGYIAIFVLPQFLNKFVFAKIESEHKRGYYALGILFAMLLGLMPATYYSEASFLMGAFVAGLTFCTNDDAHHAFVDQWKRMMSWLLRIFFAASIGFQVPVKDFADMKIIAHGLLFTLALLGKLAVGFLVPNFSTNARFTGLHLRDVLVVGFSMAAEGEFAFVIAVFGFDNGLIDKDLYSSIVLAILLSTIIAPFLLRMTISHYNKITERQIKDAEEIEFNRKMELGGAADSEGINEQLLDGINNNTTVFLCVQTQSDAGWGLLPKLMGATARLNLEVIDHRSWNPRGVNTTLMNEIYAKDVIQHSEIDGVDVALDNRLKEIQTTVLEVFKQPNAKVKVSRWIPGVVQEMHEEVVEENGVITKRLTSTVTRKGSSISDLIAKEAEQKLEKKKEQQIKATVQLSSVLETQENIGSQAKRSSMPSSPVRRRRKRMSSTPVVGGCLFGENIPAPSYDLERGTSDSVLVEDSVVSPNATDALSNMAPMNVPRRRRVRVQSTSAVGGGIFGPEPTIPSFGEIPQIDSFRNMTAEITVDGITYPIQLDPMVLSRIIKDASASPGGVGTLSSSDLINSRSDKGRRQRQRSFDGRLQGFVRIDE